MPNTGPRRPRVRWPKPRDATVVLGVAALAAGAQPATAGAQMPGATNVTPALGQLAQRDPGRDVDVIVQFHRASGATADARVRLAGGTPGGALELIGGVQARMDAGDAVRLAGQVGVRAVTLNAPVQQNGTSDIDEDRLATAYNLSIGAERVWNRDEGERGRGVGVAVVDTGIAGDHADFRSSATDPTSRVVANAVVHPDATNPGDQVGHGTHVAGLIAGNGTVRSEDDSRAGRYVGVAPEADLINVKVSDDAGATSVADVINGLQFVVDKRSQYNIRVVNLSLASTVAQSYTIDPLAAAAEQAHFAGILVVAASGNSGPNSVNFSPGNDPYVLSVGGADDQGTKTTKDDTVASWTSTGITQDGFTKPEVMAPGAKLVSTLAPAARYAEQSPSSVVEEEYLRLGGTSMAAGVVSGAAAVLARVHPTWTPSELKGALVNRSRDVKGEGTEIAVNRSLEASGSKLLANVDLVPSTLIDASTGTVDTARARWGGFEWYEAINSLRARWGSASYVCSCAKIMNLADSDPLRARWGGADTTRARWGGADSARARWGSADLTASFTR